MMEEHERAHRLNALLTEELDQTAKYYYLSFVDESGFLGAIVTMAAGPITATRKTHTLGINPGGEVQITVVPEGVDVTGRTDRLLSKAEVEAWK